MSNRRMCPNCRAFISASDRVCPYCEAQIGPRAIDLRSAQTFDTLVPKAYTSSIIILVVNVAFYVAMAIFSVHISQGTVADGVRGAFSGFSGLVDFTFGAKGPEVYQFGQWWRLVTAGFMHGGFIHIAMNMWVMFDLVAEVEQFYGTARLTVIYLVSSAFGFYLSLLWSPTVHSVGASAACFGLMGAMMALGLRRDHPMALAIRNYYRRWVIFALLFTFLAFGNVDNAAHIGGLAMGFALGYAGGLPGHKDSGRERAVQVLAGVVLVATLACFAADLRFIHAVQLRLANQ